jgi:hypothetical protein
MWETKFHTHTKRYFHASKFNVNWCKFNNEGKAFPLQTLDRPMGFQEVEAPIISRQSAHEGGKVVSPTHRPPLPPGRIPHFC